MGDAGGSYLRLIDFCITQRKAQGPSRTCNESKEEEEEEEEDSNVERTRCRPVIVESSSSSLLLSSLESSDTMSMSLKYEPASAPLHISVQQLSTPLRTNCRKTVRFEGGVQKAWLSRPPALM